MADLVPNERDPDASLLALRAHLLAAVADYGWSEMVADISDEKLTEVGDRLRDACWQIVEAPPAQTAAGIALKAASAMDQFRDGFNHAVWPGDSESMAWDVLSELAGDVYDAPTPPRLPLRPTQLCRQARDGQLEHGQSIIIRAPFRV